MDVRPIAIARRVDRFARCAQNNLAVYRASRPKAENVMMDEMESFEHTKCKPLTMPILVEAKTRKILALRVGRIAAKGHLAEISRRKYGYRKCERKEVLNQVLIELKDCVGEKLIIETDESNHYPPLIAKHFPAATHKAHKGRRGCVVGQGELKRGGHDPLFSLNQTYAKIRDNLKTLSRRTWCTAKLPHRLEALLYINAWFHNLMLEKTKTKVRIGWLFPSAI